MEEPVKWITVNGNHIPIYEGQDKLEAMRNFYAKKKSLDRQSDKLRYEFLPEDDLEADDLYDEMSDICWENLSQEDVYQIQDNYIGKEESWQFNEDLRNGKPVDPKLKGALDRACNSYKAERDMAGMRMVSFDYLRNAYGLDIPRYGDIDRSVFAEQMKQFLGTELSSKSYTSLSLSENGSGTFGNLAVKMQINMPKGTPMYVADNISEYEAILGRNTKMRLTDVGFQKSKIKGFEKEYGKVLLTYEVVK